MFNLSFFFECLNLKLQAGRLKAWLELKNLKLGISQGNLSLFGPAAPHGAVKVYCSDLTYTLEAVQDFLIKLDIKPLMHLLEISTFSLNNFIIRLTKIMNRADKN